MNTKAENFWSKSSESPAPLLPIQGHKILENMSPKLSSMGLLGALVHVYGEYKQGLAPWLHPLLFLDVTPWVWLPIVKKKQPLVNLPTPPQIFSSLQCHTSAQRGGLHCAPQNPKKYFGNRLVGTMKIGNTKLRLQEFREWLDFILFYKTL